MHVYYHQEPLTVSGACPSDPSRCRVIPAAATTTSYQTQASHKRHRCSAASAQPKESKQHMWQQLRQNTYRITPCACRCGGQRLIMLAQLELLAGTQHVICSTPLAKHRTTIVATDLHSTTSSYNSCQTQWQRLTFVVLTRASSLKADGTNM